MNRLSVHIGPITMICSAQLVLNGSLVYDRVRKAHSPLQEEEVLNKRRRNYLKEIEAHEIPLVNS